MINECPVSATMHRVECKSATRSVGSAFVTVMGDFGARVKLAFQRCDHPGAAEVLCRLPCRVLSIVSLPPDQNSCQF